MKITRIMTLLLLAMFIVAGCTYYDEEPELVTVKVKLLYPKRSPVGPYEGARVELANASSSIFVDSTDAEGVATFHVPGGLYNAVSSETYVTTIKKKKWRYIFNGRNDQQVVSPDSVSNTIDIKLTMTRKRVWW